MTLFANARWSNPLAVVNIASIPPGQAFSTSIPFQLTTPTNYVRLEGSNDGSFYVSKRINTIPLDQPFNQVRIVAFSAFPVT